MTDGDEDCVNFDLDRMQQSIDSASITIPDGLTWQELIEWLANRGQNLVEHR
ncbi:hypothetical protein D9M71_716970 [compost metagenome]